MGSSQDKNVEKLADQFCQFLLKTYPVMASFVGVHEGDEDFPDFSPSGVARRMERLERFKTALKAVNRRSVSPALLVDLDLMLGKIEVELLLNKKYPLYKILPDLYLNEALFGVYILITRDFAPLRDRALSATRRLAQIPNLLRHARKNLKNPPPEFIESALHTCSGAMTFFNDSIPIFSMDVHGALKEALLEANEEAIAELKAFATYLKEDLLPKAKGSYSIGKPIYNLLLKHAHHLPYTSDNLLKMAKKTIKEIETEANAVAAKIRKKKSWRETVEDLKEDHPSTQGLVGAYKREIKRARQFVESMDLVTIPEDEEIEVMPTPPFASSLIPYATYLAPAPLEERQKGSFWVTVPVGMTVSEAKERLRGHSKWGLAVTALHEGYPGHHLQLVTSNRNRNLLRHLAQTPVFSEGWAFYCEEMMWENGFYEDPRQRLLQLRDALWRACRVVIDVGLHTKTMSISEAVDMLVETVGLERPNAEAEVRRYCQTPTQPMAYLIGKIEIQNLLRDVQKAQGKNFDLKSFHDRLLSYGTLPIARIRDLMEAQGD